MPMNTSALASTATEPAQAAPRTDAPARASADGRRRIDTGSAVTAVRGRLERKGHPPVSAAHGTRKRPNEDDSESAPASAIRITLETIENDRSRRRGTSNAWSTWTHRNNDASRTRAWSTEPASCTLCMNAANAASRPTESKTLVVMFDRWRCRYEKT